MTANSIDLIQTPNYSVDFRQYSKRQRESESPISSKVARAIVLPFLLLKEVSTAAVTAGYDTLRYSGTSFKHIVLNYTGSWSSWRPPANLPLVIFKIVVWVAALNLCFLTTTARLLYERTQNVKDSESFLSRYANREIDVSHIVTRDLKVDTSAVSASVKVSGLLEIFDQINFTDAKSPGYMSPKSRVEGGTEYSVKQLQDGLKTFVDHVNGRVAFLGTPPAYDTPRLFVFYEHIENVVRFAIHNSDQAIKDFKAIEGDDHNQYSDSALNTWKNLLEDRARIAINLAIAGKHCGARYMGEATELYLELTQQGSDRKEGLKEILCEILAKERAQLAAAQIQQRLGNDTHSFARYMSALGKTLAIPGMSSVVEHLSAPLDKDAYLKLFFAQYTVDRIIAAVQERVKQSQPLRDKIIDWIKDQRGSWQPDGVIPLDEQLAIGEAALAKDGLDDAFVPYKDLRVLKDAVLFLINLQVKSGDAEDPTDLLFSNDNDYWKKTYPKQMTRLQVRNRTKGLFSDNQLGKELTARVQTALSEKKELDIKPFTKRLVLLQKSAQLCKHLHLDATAALRVTNNELSLKEALETNHRLSAEPEFLSSLKLDTIAENGLSDEIIEWLLVSQEILLSQSEGA